MTTYRDRHLAGLYDSEEAAADKDVAALKESLKALGEPVSGNKNQLEKRLTKAQQAAQAE